jgi:hypothetical protein
VHVRRPARRTAARPALAALTAVLTAGAVVGTAVPAAAHDTGAHAPRQALAAVATTGKGVGVEHVANVPHQLFLPGEAQNGSDIEFMTVAGRDYALAGTLRNGLQITDITDPTQPVRAAVYDCSITQGDIQVFRQGSRVLATYTADAAIAPRAATGTRTEANEKRFNAACVREANALGAQIDGSELGTFLVDLTDPRNPKTAGFLEVPKGSHNQTVHPSGEYLYNSNSDLVVNSPLPQITIHDIRDPAKPRFVQNFSYPPGQPALGEESHDIFFNATGTRAYVASLGSTLILDTSKPESPRIVSQFIDPANSLVHQSDIVSLPRKDGTLRTLLITTDEQAGALEQSNCPGGGLHVYDITGDKERDPLRNKLGVWFIPVAEARPNETCTSHVLRMHPEQGLMTIAWYTAGVRVLDISGLAEVTGNAGTVARGNGVGMREVGSFEFPDSDVWSFKTNRIAADGSFFGYGNDLGRGLDVYRFTGGLPGGRTVPPLAPEDLAAQGCSGVPIARAYADRAAARDVHKRSIDCVIARAVARGSVADGQRVYRPGEDVTRGQMASFILGTLRAAGQDQELPAPKAGAFRDVAGNVHQGAIEVLAAAGIVQGTGDGTTYAPNAPVTREQMASFVVRAAQFAVEPDLGESGARRFTDVPDGSTHAAAIAIGDDNRLFTGTTATTFSPRVVVKRDQMATFLTNLLGVAGRGNTVPAGLG